MNTNENEPQGFLRPPKRCKPISNEAATFLEGFVGNRQIFVTSTFRDYPEGIAIAPESDFHRTAFVGTTYQGPQLVEGPFAVREGGHLVFQKTWRYCEHDGNPHINADIIAYWEGLNGKWYRSIAGMPVDHYLTLASGTANTVIRDWLVDTTEGVESLKNTGIELSIYLTDTGPTSDY